MADEPAEPLTEGQEHFSGSGDVTSASFFVSSVGGKDKGMGSTKNKTTWGRNKENNNNNTRSSVLSGIL